MFDPVSGMSSRITYWSFATAPSEVRSPAAIVHCANLMFASVVKTTRSIIGAACGSGWAVTKNYAPRNGRQSRQCRAKCGPGYISLDNGCLGNYYGRHWSADHVHL